MQRWGYSTENHCDRFRALQFVFLPDNSSSLLLPFLVAPQHLTHHTSLVAEGCVMKQGCLSSRRLAGGTGRSCWSKLGSLFSDLCPRMSPGKPRIFWQGWQPWARRDSPAHRYCGGLSHVICTWPANPRHPASVGCPGLHLLPREVLQQRPWP